MGESEGVRTGREKVAELHARIGACRAGAMMFLDGAASIGEVFDF